jgi:sterol desaturase/sphingolipid hydroxylase (fatty acid hydroxylase superfamily)
MKVWPLAFWTVLATFFAFTGIRNGSLPGVYFATIGVIGVLSWTLVEYAFHRWVLHSRPQNRTLARLLFFLHGNHHADPNNRERLVMPLHFTIPYFVLSFTPTAALLGWTLTLPLYAGFLFGYVVHDLMHLYLHTGRPRLPALQRLQKSHMDHHFKSSKRGFGVSSLLWDRIGRT